MSSEKLSNKLYAEQRHLPPPIIAKSRSRLVDRRIWLPCCLLLLYQLVKFSTLGYVKSEGYIDRHAGEQKWAYDAFKARHATNALSTAELEKLYLSVPDPASALAASRAYATHPHIASSKEDFEDSLVILKLFQDEFDIPAPNYLPVFPAGTEASRSATLGINKLKKPSAWVDVYYPIMNSPLDRALQILDDDGAVAWNADLVEDGDPADPEAAKYKDYIPTFPWPERRRGGVNFTGKIVLTRYGGIFRGLKIKGAQELGAVGVLIYSDPRDDGVVTVDNGYVAYPRGPARNPTSVQRGSVQFISLYPGDPATPGYPAYANATRTAAENIPKIPSLPISWANAQRLLAEIGPESKSRKLTGKSSKSIIKLVNHVDNKVMPIWNTVAAIPGHIKNETVLIGCHRDAWVMGAGDPISGTASLHEVIRGFGVLLKNGWKPLRNVVIISWDAEEYGLVGSTEWAEDFAEWIGENIVTYINLDVSVTGSQWHAAASPSLAHLIRKSALEIPHPTIHGKTLWDAQFDNGPYHEGEMDAEFAAQYTASHPEDTGIPPLGSGSDFTAFLQRIGIASMDQSFFGTPHDAVYHYHSIYDSQRWQEIFADPGFYRHTAVAKHLGLVALRLIDSIILPLNTTQYSLELDSYLSSIEGLAQSLDSSVDFSGLQTSVHKVQEASLELDVEKHEAEEKFKELLEKLPKPPTDPRAFIRWIKWLLRLRNNPIHQFIKAAKRVQKANSKLVAFEKGFISEEGIKDREWYRHLGVAPGKWLGYGATTFPSIYDALVWDKNATAAQHQVDRVSKALDKLSDVLKP
ncbi:hypothetical protein NM688_g4581 [Phlebia brevispora]|uniref:Uncharacterized protein n=1 Tax=Phlebia brevispora TaxID=194682 RepID=A0ACC1T2N8_9APHY|nr:hypothetical protein NM688_g4581 [Phlebia brevispora]